MWVIVGNAGKLGNASNLGHAGRLQLGDAGEVM